MSEAALFSEDEIQSSMLSMAYTLARQIQQRPKQATFNLTASAPSVGCVLKFPDGSVLIQIRRPHLWITTSRLGLWWWPKLYGRYHLSEFFNRWDDPDKPWRVMFGATILRGLMETFAECRRRSDVSISCKLGFMNPWRVGQPFFIAARDSLLSQDRQ